MIEEAKTFIIFLLISILIGVIVGFVYNPQDNNGEKIDCFDRYGNKIIGETCELIDYYSPLEKKFIAGFSVFIVAIMFCILIYSLIDFNQWSWGTRGGM